jgi:hypothetical protein
MRKKVCCIICNLVMLEKENIRQVVIACEYPLSDSKIVHDSISL